MSRPSHLLAALAALAALAVGPAAIAAAIAAGMTLRRRPRLSIWLTVVAVGLAVVASALYAVAEVWWLCALWAVIAAIDVVTLHYRRRFWRVRTRLLARCARSGHGPVAAAPGPRRWLLWRRRGSVRICWACRTPLTLRDGMDARRRHPRWTVSPRVLVTILLEVGGA